jgi:hypothetical protein
MDCRPISLQSGEVRANGLFDNADLIVSYRQAQHAKALQAVVEFQSASILLPYSATIAPFGMHQPGSVLNVENRAETNAAQGDCILAAKKINPN